MDLWLDGGQLGDLMPQGLDVLTRQGVPAPPALGGLAFGDRSNALGWDQSSRLPGMALLCAPPFLRRWLGGLPLHGDRVGRWGPGAVG